MISRALLATGGVFAALSDAGSLETIKNILLVVFLAVAVVWLVIDARRNLIATYGGSPVAASQPAVAPAAAPTPVAAAAAAIPVHVVAAIAAAVHYTLGPKAHIVSINDDDDGLAWAAEGRRAIYATRKVR